MFPARTVPVRPVVRPLHRRAVLALAVVVGCWLGYASPAGASDATTDPASTPAELVETTAQPAVLTSHTGPANSANARYVVDVYTQLLGRGVDTGGLDFHVGRLAGGGKTSRQLAVEALLFSAEGSRREVRAAYTDLLNRSADLAGEDYWTAHLQSHGVLDLRVLLLASDEYVAAAGGTESAWINAMYLDTLGRAAEPAGLLYWEGRLAADVPRAIVAASIYRSDEALGRRADHYYDEALGRYPGPLARAGTIDELQTQGERRVRARLWASDEAFEPHLLAVWP